VVMLEVFPILVRNVWWTAPRFTRWWAAAPDAAYENAELTNEPVGIPQGHLAGLGDG